MEQTKMKQGQWIDLKKRQPERGSRVLACDEFGYVTILEVVSVRNRHVGCQEWTEAWRYGNGTDLVAWMPIPPWPKDLCDERADGEMPL